LQQIGCEQAAAKEIFYTVCNRDAKSSNF